MSKKSLHRPTVEALEARIAPAAVATVYPTIQDAELAYDANPFGDNHFVHAVTGTPILLKAGQVLTTGSVARSGAYLMFVEKGEALIFTTDLNNNGVVDYNEITGVAASDGLRLTSFVDIHGDIVTNLDSDRTLSDSDNNASNNPVTGGDGRVLKNNTIESITLRSLTPADLTDQNNSGGATADNTDVALRLSLSSYSIFGQILAGKGFGVPGDPTSGLHIDTTGAALQKLNYTATGGGSNLYVDTKPTVGAIRTGTATNGEYFSFGYSRNVDIQGDLTPYTPLAGQPGGDIAYVVPTTVLTGYNFSGAYAGDGGTGARGGNIYNVTVDRDNASGYNIVAGDGGRGSIGGVGGSIVNFTDLGSATGEVNLQTGNGGQGTNGVGGDGGTLGLGTVNVITGGVSQVANLNVNGGVTINLGDGGTGFKGGGNGSSLTNIVVRAPEDAVVLGQTVVGTTHDGTHNPATHLLTTGAVIGRANSFDFDNDGNNDVVFTTSQPEQVGVAFGDGFGGFSHVIYLDGPQEATSVVVADINGDGHQDIVVGSSKDGDFSGVTVFLAQFEDKTHNGLTPTEDVNMNGIDDFVKFSSPRISPLPSLASGDPTSPNSFDFRYLRSSNPITQLVAGDFHGDGKTEIALTASYVSGGLSPSLEQVLMILTPDYENGVGTGHLYADMGDKGNSLLPFTSIGSGNGSRLESTALSQFATHDVVLVTQVNTPYTVGGIQNTTITNFLSLYDFSDVTAGPTFLNALPFDKVDTDRTLGKIASATSFLKDFAIVDFDQNGTADYIGLTDTPAGFLVGISGDGARSGYGILENYMVNKAGNLLPDTDNAGYMVKGMPIAVQATLPTGSSMLGLATIDYATPLGGSLVVANLTTYTFYDPTVFVSPPTPPTLPFATNPGVNSLNKLATNALEDLPASVAFDTYTPLAGSLNSAFAYTSHDVNFSDFNLETSASFSPTPLAGHFLALNAGDGGDGILGKGGNGGSIGNGSLQDTGTQLVGSFDFTLPISFGGNGHVTLSGGQGGNGFSSGGNGGDVTGAAIRPNPSDTLFTDSVQLFAGNGGTGKSATGGRGGNLAHNSMFVAGLQVAGNGGAGMSGGNGGSITGHGFTGYGDDREPDQYLYAGTGGDGTRRGGAGGSIINFHPQFDITFLGTSGGLISYVAGDGGSAISGAGGAGGDVIGTSPFTGGAGSAGQNVLAGDILLKSGTGGDGATGGRGGDIANFINRESGDSPSVLAFIAGNGGHGVSGNGGRGGNVMQLNVASTGNHHSNTPFADVTYFYDHILAGAGGSSAGAAGGDGGSVTSVITNTSGNIYAVASGAGGSGLTKGGKGGNIDTLSLAVGGQPDSGGSTVPATDSPKGLIIAGAGGSAGAFDSTASQIGFGGKIGKGGDGGDIRNFLQTGGIDAHFDLIAGNGGDTLHFGSLADRVGAAYVGTGGSISGVIVQGRLGNTDGDVPIVSYNNLKGGQSMAQFVDSVLRTSTDAKNLGDDKGNVGIVVGGAGRLKSIFIGYDSNHQAVFRSVAAFQANNGSLNEVHASAILSAVADSVDRIATINKVNNVLDINNPSRSPVIGSNKIPLGIIEYGDKDSTDGMIQDPAFPTDPTKRIFPTIPETDGYLIDGALVSRTAPTQTDANGIKTDLKIASGSHTFVIT